jgi:hypothetical protein
MAQYIVIAGINIGTQYDNNGVATSVTITKGQVVEGDPTTKTYQGVTTQGIMYHVPSKITGENAPEDGLEYFFIPMTFLTQKLLPGDMRATQSIFTLNNTLIGVGILVVLSGIIFWISKLKKNK